VLTLDPDLRIFYSGTESGSVGLDQVNSWSVFVPIGTYSVRAPDGYCEGEERPSNPLAGCENPVEVIVTLGDEIEVNFYNNNAPEARIEVTALGDGSRAFLFSGAGSRPGIFGDELEYEWSFSDGHAATGIETIHAFDEPGDYTVVLTVTNSDGISDTASELVKAASYEVSGKLYEQLCGDDSTRQLAWSGAGVNPQKLFLTGTSQTQVSGSEYSFEAAQGEIVTVVPEVIAQFGAPQWEPFSRTVSIGDSDVEVADMVRCFSPDSPAVINPLFRNRLFVSDSLSVRNGGVVRICNVDRVLMQPYSPNLQYDGPRLGGSRKCDSFRVMNPTNKLRYADIYDAVHALPWLPVVIVPGEPVAGVANLTGPARRGQNRLDVGSNNGFRPGDRIVVDPDGPGQRVYTVSGLGSLLLTEPLLQDYPEGTLVVNLTQPPGGVPFVLADPPGDSAGIPDGSNFPILGGSPAPAATSAPAATPVSEVSGIRSAPITPPSTGSGGLKSAGLGHSLLAVPLAMLAAAVLLRRLVRRA
jgi:PKD repeat protein